MRFVCLIFVYRHSKSLVREDVVVQSPKSFACICVCIREDGLQVDDEELLPVLLDGSFTIKKPHP